MQLAFERALGVIASVLTIINFFWALNVEVPVMSITPSSFQISSLLVSVIVFVLLEICISLFFSYALVKNTEKVKDKLLSSIITFLLATASVYTSLFNIGWFFLSGDLSEFAMFFGYLFWVAVANLLFSATWCYVDTARDKGTFQAIFVVHGFWFIVISIILSLDGFFT
ncbi:TPA: hypothetical protein ACRZZJ_003526 [Vibrio harveyi]